MICKARYEAVWYRTLWYELRPIWRMSHNMWHVICVISYSTIYDVIYHTGTSDRLQVPGEEKQRFLDEGDAISMISAIRRAYIIETRLLETMISQSQIHSDLGNSSFSLN